jgi:hypothetical protein
MIKASAMRIKAECVSVSREKQKAARAAALFVALPAS